MIRLFLLTASLGMIFTLNAQAQRTGGTGTSGGTGGSSFSGGGSSFGGGTSLGGGSSFAGGGTGLTGGGTGLTGGSNSGFTGSGPTRTGAGGRSTTGTAISTTNFLSSSYGNPLYPGRPGSSNYSITGGGGFGQPTLTNTSNSGTTGGVGNRGGTATVSGSTSGTQTNNSSSRIQHTTTMKFPVKPVAYDDLKDELRQILDRSTSIKQPDRITVLIEGNTVVLKGVVSDADERQLVEGMVRLTPGVYSVRNELQAP